MDGRIRESLELVGLAGMERRSIGRLSGGEKQRLALASVLAMHPEIIILDEPTANLDPKATADFFQTMAPLKGKHTILIIEHKLDECIRMVDRVLILSDGGALLAEGEPRAIFARRAEDLRKYGIWIPQVTEWALRLRGRKRGIGEENLPLTTEDVMALYEKGVVSLEDLLHGERRSAVTRKGVLAADVRGLSFSYPRGNRPALDSARLQVPEGSLFALLGPNGSGKSTLAAHLIAIHEPPPGKVFVFGRDVSPKSGMSLRGLTELVGYVFQNPEHQFVTDTVYDEVAYGLRARGYDEGQIDARVREILEDFHLTRLSRANPFTLSQGQKRRLSVATMLAVGQKLLVLDEPTFGQDRLTTERMIARWRRLRERGVTILFITHDMRLVLEVADMAAVLSEGRTIYQGDVETLYREHALLERANLLPPPMFRIEQEAGLRQISNRGKALLSSGTEP
jgi:energy-coupling factor transport system ATP-binding protein